MLTQSEPACSVGSRENSGALDGKLHCSVLLPRQGVLLRSPTNLVLLETVSSYDATSIIFTRYSTGSLIWFPNITLQMTRIIY